MKPPPLKQWKAVADVVRDWAALLYTPVLTAYAVWVTAMVAWAYPWAPATEGKRLDVLGAALIGALVLIGLGTLFYQRRPPPHIRARLPAAELEISSGRAPDAGRPAPEGRESGRRGPGSRAGVGTGAPS